MKKFGLDFGTTNSSISVSDGKSVKVIPIDKVAPDPRVVRSMLYFFRREIVVDPKIPKERLLNNVFKEGEMSYVGEFKYQIGQEAVETYLKENKHRSAGVKRTFYTGRFIILGTASEDQAKADPVAEYYEEIDYGTGRLLQALKSSLKTSFKGSNIFGKFFTVEELIGTFVGEIKKNAEKESGAKIENIRVGRPVVFSLNPDIDNLAQQRLKEAMKVAGFKNVEFEYEPVAAARQFASLSGKDQIVLVFDFGGGTLDTALVKVEKGKFAVLATDGVYIGGDLLNADIMQAKLWDYFGASASWGEFSHQVPLHIYHALNSWYSIPTLNNPETLSLIDNLRYKHSDPEALDRLVHLVKANVGFEIYEAIERAKKQLSTEKEARIIYQDGPIDLNVSITRAEFEDIISPRVEEIKEVVIRTLSEANLSPEQVDIVVRTGGSSLIPIFQNMLEEIFGKEKVELFETFTSIAAGLALEDTK